MISFNFTTLGGATLCHSVDGGLGSGRSGMEISFVFDFRAYAHHLNVPAAVVCFFFKVDFLL